MFGTGKGAFIAACLAALFVAGGASWGAFAQTPVTWVLPCDPSPLLNVDPLNANVLGLSRSVALSAPATGCLADLAPLTVRPQAATPTGKKDKESRPDALRKGLLAKLQRAWDQTENFSQRDELAAHSFRFGNVATLETERETILAFLEKVANNLIPSSQNGGTPSRQMGFTLNLDNIPLNAQTLLGGHSAFSVDENLNVFLEDLTITVTNGTLTGQTEFNPESMTFERGAFSINLDIGNARVSSTTTFEKDQGVTKQVLDMTAGLGQLQLHSQVTFTLNSSEFLLGASISDLDISTTTLVDVFGNHSQTFALEMDF